MIAVVKPSRWSTSGRASVGMKPCTNALYVSLINRWDSAAIVSKTSELFPEPETPVKAVKRRFGTSTLTSLRLFTRAPCTLIRSWLSAWVIVLLASRQPDPAAHERTTGDLVRLPPRLDPHRAEDHELVATPLTRIPVGLGHVRRPEVLVRRHLNCALGDRVDHHHVPSRADSQSSATRVHQVHRCPRRARDRN